MEIPTGMDLPEFASALIHSRQHVAPRRLVDPGPGLAQVQTILAAAGAAPDHGKLLPWRFVLVPVDKRQVLAEVFGLALQDRDPQATVEQIDNAQEKAHRAPLLLLAIARLAGSDPELEAARAQAGQDCDLPSL